MEYYPLTFNPIIKERIWGGQKLHTLFGKPGVGSPAGESWELSGVAGNISIVNMGPLQGRSLNELIQSDPVGILGEEALDRFGTVFPILIKFIDARTDLSIQVHPDDELAAQKHGGKGKTEMWYIMDAHPDAHLILGFKEVTDRPTYEAHLKNKTLLDILHRQPVKAGDTYFIRAGTVHAIGGGIVLAEIQQTSDITYRIYDYDRPGRDGKPRELHTEMALDAMTLAPAEGAKINYTKSWNRSDLLVDSPYFKTHMLPVLDAFERDLSQRKAFSIYICVEGEIRLEAGSGNVVLTQGSTALLPAQLNRTSLYGHGEILEITV